ncbi:MAG: hypothetical protein JST01_06350 [Cyanobacteria bacterium SZAS TMP-1]|nr:hypothetical protein [Cyanobacteria bacterium SZAS TMP-1]
MRLLVSIILHPLRIGWDPSLHLMCANLICQGKLPYVDMFDVNPPLIWYLNTLPASLASAFNCPLPLAFNLFLLFIIALSGLMSAYVVIKKFELANIFVNLGIVFGLLTSNFFLTVDFGQREEIFVLLFMPYFFLRAARWNGAKVYRWEAILFGLIGAAGLFMKHYFLLNWLCIEGFFFLSCRKRSFIERVKILGALENLMMAFFGAVYLSHFFLLPPAVRRNYFDFLLPAFSRGYFFWDTSVPSCIAMPNKRNVFFLFVTSAALGLSIVRSVPIIAPVISFGLAGVVVYLIQFKAWAYQDIPVMAAGFMLAGALMGAVVANIAARLKTKTSSGASVIAYTLSVTLAGFCLVSASDEISYVQALPRFDLSQLGYSGYAPLSDLDSPFADLILKNSKIKDPIVFISNAVSPGFPILMQLRRTPASRHLHVCILSVLQFIRSSSIRDDKVNYLLSQEKVVADQLGEDITHSRAPLVFLQEAPVRDDYLARYDFEKRYLSNYTLLDSVYGFSVYKLNASGVPGAK